MTPSSLPRDRASNEPRAVQTLTYTPTQQLESISDTNGTTTYSYDVDGTRILANDGTQTTLTIGPYERTVTNATSTQTNEVFYYRGPGGLAAMQVNGELQYLFTDHVDSIAATWTPSTDTTITAQYHPYGEQRGGGSFDTSYGYTSQRNDTSGLMYYNARYYDPHTGLFAQPDTIIPGAADPQGFNRYMYVTGNPVRFNDPTGRYLTCDVDGSRHCRPAASAGGDDSSPPSVLDVYDAWPDLVDEIDQTAIDYWGACGTLTVEAAALLGGVARKEACGVVFDGGAYLVDTEGLGVSIGGGGGISLGGGIIRGSGDPSGGAWCASVSAGAVTSASGFICIAAGENLQPDPSVGWISGGEVSFGDGGINMNLMYTESTVTYIPGSVTIIRGIVAVAEATTAVSEFVADTARSAAHYDPVRSANGPYSESTLPYGCFYGPGACD